MRTFLKYTVIELPEFQELADKLWSEDERLAFIDEISSNPLLGDVIQGADGLRKVRWKAKGKGKRGGARIIYYNLLDDGCILLLDLYTKNEKEDLTPKELKQLKGVKNG